MSEGLDWNNPHQVNSECERLVRKWKQNFECKTFTNPQRAFEHPIISYLRWCKKYE